MQLDTSAAQAEFFSKGWLRFQSDPATLAWATHASKAGLEALKDPELSQWHDCEGTWFVGVDALENDVCGRLPDGPDLDGPALSFLRETYGSLLPLHRAQLSVMFPGYPRPKGGENDAAFRYRLKRDAAHVDGIKLFGEARRRKVEEPHAWVLGLPLNSTSPDAAPLVIWEGSHHVMAEAFSRVFSDHPPERWADLDITDTYVAARRTVFDTCPRVTVHAEPGESYLMHRLCLHGVAPWAKEAMAPEGEGRMIAYFRPELPDWQTHWLQLR